MTSPSLAPPPPSPTELLAEEGARLEITRDHQADQLVQSLADSEAAAQRINQLEAARLKNAVKLGRLSIKTVEVAAKTIDYASAPGIAFVGFDKDGKRIKETDQSQSLVGGDERAIGFGKSTHADRAADRLTQSAGGLRLESHSTLSQNRARGNRIIGWFRRTLHLGDPLITEFKYSGREKGHGLNDTNHHADTPYDAPARVDPLQKDPYHYDTIAHKIRTKTEAMAMVAAAAEHNLAFMAADDATGKARGEVINTKTLQERALKEHRDTLQERANGAPERIANALTYATEAEHELTGLLDTIRGSRPMTIDEIMVAATPDQQAMIGNLHVECSYWQSVAQTNRAYIIDAKFNPRGRDTRLTHLLEIQKNLQTEGERLHGAATGAIREGQQRETGLVQDAHDMLFPLNPSDPTQAERYKTRTAELAATEHNLHTANLELTANGVPAFDRHHYETFTELRDARDAAVEGIRTSVSPTEKAGYQQELARADTHLNQLLGGMDYASLGGRRQHLLNKTLAQIASLDTRRHHLRVMRGDEQLSHKLDKNGSSEYIKVAEMAHAVHKRYLGVVAMHAAIESDLPNQHLGENRHQTKQSIDELEKRVALHGATSEQDIKRALESLIDNCDWKKETHMQVREIKEQNFITALSNLGLTSMEELPFYGYLYDENLGVIQPLSAQDTAEYRRVFEQEQAKNRALITAKREEWLRLKERLRQNEMVNVELDEYQHQVLGRRVKQTAPNTEANHTASTKALKRQIKLYDQMDGYETQAIQSQNALDTTLEALDEVDTKLARLP